MELHGGLDPLVKWRADAKRIPLLYGILLELTSHFCIILHIGIPIVRIMITSYFKIERFCFAYQLSIYQRRSFYLNFDFF